MRLILVLSSLILSFCSFAMDESSRFIFCDYSRINLSPRGQGPYSYHVNSQEFENLASEVMNSLKWVSADEMGRLRKNLRDFCSAGWVKKEDVVAGFIKQLNDDAEERAADARRRKELRRTRQKRYRDKCKERVTAALQRIDVAAPVLDTPKPSKKRVREEMDDDVVPSISCILQGERLLEADFSRKKIKK